MGDREKFEKVLRGRSYEDRMAEVGMTSLLNRRVRGHDCHLLHHDREGQGGPRTFFEMAEEGAGPRTRLVAGVHNIRETRSRLDIRRYSFSQRVASTWNSLQSSLASPQGGRDCPGVSDWLRRVGDCGEVGSLTTGMMTGTWTAPNH